MHSWWSDTLRKGTVSLFQPVSMAPNSPTKIGASFSSRKWFRRRRIIAELTKTCRIFIRNNKKQKESSDLRIKKKATQRKAEGSTVGACRICCQNLSYVSLGRNMHSYIFLKTWKWHETTLHAGWDALSHVVYVTKSLIIAGRGHQSVGKIPALFVCLHTTNRN